MTDFTLAHRGVRRSLSGIMAVVLIAGGFALACAPMAYMLWPQSAPVAPDAPSLPITVGNVVFNVPPAAIRVRLQRRPGAQPRLDLVYAWPSLTPPEPAAKGTQAAPSLGERVFVTILPSDGTLPPLERLKVIYPRYAAPASAAGPDGLVVQSFRNGTPYHGEDLIYDPAAPERFLLRCTRTIAATPGMCLHERRMAGADITVRFPRDWLADWRAVASSVDRLIAGFRTSGG
jgi:hypothetical protein